MAKKVSAKQRKLRQRIQRIIDSLRRRDPAVTGATVYLVRQRGQFVTGTTCPYCEGLLKVKDLTLDHRTPLSRGGTSAPDNLVYCHRACNERKGLLTDLEYEILLMALRKLPPEAARDVLRRLRAGAKRYG